MNKTDLILHVENEEDDVFIVKRAMKKVGIENPVMHMENGEMVVSYLSECRLDASERNKLPSLILLDLSMPRMGGIEVLRWIRAQPVIKRIAVVVLTSSQNQQDIADAYEHGASSYLVKPVGVPQFQTVFESFKKFWVDNNQTAT